MFGKEIVLSKNNTSIISKGLVLKGNLVSDGLLEVEGKINGNVKGNEITIRETGSVSGKIIANVLNIKPFEIIDVLFFDSTIIYTDNGFN